MRLADLDPQWWKVYRDHETTPDRGGVPTGEVDLAFNCPSCGAPYRIFIRLGMTRQDSPRRWAMNKDHTVSGWIDQLTVTPSINNTLAGHGPRHPTCGFHGSIVNGEINLK